LKEIREGELISGPLHSFIQIGHAFTTADITSAFEIDWAQIEWMKFGFMRGDSNKKSVYEALKLNYHIICNLFQHFAGAGQLGERYGLTVLEFGHLFHFARLINYRLNPVEIDDLFYASIGSMMDASERSSLSSAPLMSRTNLVEAIVRYSIDRRTSINGEMKDEKKEERKGEVFVDRSSSEAIINIIEGPLSNAWISISSNFLVPFFFHLSYIYRQNY